MTTTRQQLTGQLMEMLGNEATERDGEIAFDHLFAAGTISRDPDTPGNYILSETTDAEWQAVLDAIPSQRPAVTTPQITWSAKSNSSYLNGSRSASSIRAAVLAARYYVRYELGGEGVATIYSDGVPVREDRNDIRTNHRWVTTQL